MRNWFLLLISVAALAQAAPPARVEIDYEVTRNGMALADIEHRFEHTGGAYQVTETWRGRGLFFLRGKIRRESRGAITAQGLQPLEYSDMRTGRDTERAELWLAKERDFLPVRLLIVGKDGTRLDQVATRISSP